MLSAAAFAQGLMEEGKQLFMQATVPACAVCHTLKHAGAAGEVGPSLDELKPDAARVEKAIRNGIGQMPAFENLTDAQVQLLSKYVAESTGSK
jgi:mono/diheme cytochrome c family protein